MQLLRVEHEELRIGPYSYELEEKPHRVAELHGLLQRTSPWEDPFLKDWWRRLSETSFSKRFEWRFGFVTYEQFDDWFTAEACLDYTRFGFVLSIYEVEDEKVFLGATQAIFHFTSSTRISFHGLTEK
jgi:hypothetical protein